MPRRIRLFEFHLLCGQRFLFALFASRFRPIASVSLRSNETSGFFLPPSRPLNLSCAKAISRVQSDGGTRRKEKRQGRELNFVKSVAALDSNLSNGFCPATGRVVVSAVGYEDQVRIPVFLHDS